jgi:hypothetical protein
VVRVVLAVEVVDVARPDERAPDLARDPLDSLVGAVLLREPVGLDLEVHVVLPEHPEQIVGVGARVGGPPVDESPTEPRLEAAGEHDDPVGVALEQLHVGVGAPARETLEEARRAELDQVAKPCLVPRQQREVVALVAHLVGRALQVVDEICLHPEDRLHARRATRLVHLDRPVHHPVVG